MSCERSAEAGCRRTDLGTRGDGRAATRRQFLQRTGCGIFTIAALGLPDAAGALPVSPIVGDGAGHERRYPIAAGDGVSIDRGSQVIVVRYANRVYAMALACPHENAAVKWLAKDRRFQCTKHDSQYTPEGAYTTGHATRNLDRFPVRRDGAALVVDVDRVYRSDQDLAAWKAASIDVSD
jgi:nitrite reductase/ring-hydroxylating ferredoxin subunit